MKKAYSAVIISILASLALALLQFFLSKVSGSVAMHADAWHNASDLVTSFLVLSALSLKSTLNKKSQILQKRSLIFENSVYLIIGSAILMLAFRIFHKAFSPATPDFQFSWLLIAATVLCLLVIFITAFYRVRVGRETENQLLVADGLHAWSDLLSTFVLLFSLLGYPLGLNLDRPASLIIAFIIVKTGFSVIFNSPIGKIIIARMKLIKQRIPHYSLIVVCFNFVKAPVASIVNRLGIPQKGLFEFLYDKSEDAVNQFHEHRRRYLAMFACSLVALYMLSGFQAIPPDATGIKLRFGMAASPSLAPGLRYALPWPFEAVQTVKDGEIRRVEVGFRTRFGVTDNDEPFAYLWEYSRKNARFQELPGESTMITGDEYFLISQISIQYKISRPRNYLFHIDGLDELIRFIAMDFTGRIVNGMKMDDILITSRTEIERELAETLQQTMDIYDAGVTIFKVCFRDMHPPVEVVKAFREVASAREYRNQLINKAQGYANQTLPGARGRAKEKMVLAEGEAYRTVAESRGKSSRFTANQKAHRISPSVTKRRLYLETVERVLANKEKLVIQQTGSEKLPEYEKLYMFHKFFNKKTKTNEEKGQ